MQKTETPILFYDGECGLCNRSVRFIEQRDPLGHFRFAPIGGETWNERVKRNPAESVDSVHLLIADKLLVRSAALRVVLSQLRAPWPIVAAVLWCIPKPLRDLGYIVVARMRRSILSPRTWCPLPSGDEHQRYLP